MRQSVTTETSRCLQTASCQQQKSPCSPRGFSVPLCYRTTRRLRQSKRKSIIQPLARFGRFNPCAQLCRRPSSPGTGCSGPWMHLCSHRWNSRSSSPPSPPTAARCCDASRLISSACHPPQKKSSSLSRTVLLMPTRNSSSGCCRRRTTANDGGGTGWIWRVIRISRPLGTPPTLRRGCIETGSLRLSMQTCTTTNLFAISWPQT